MEDDWIALLGYILGPAGLAAIVAAIIALSRRRMQTKGEYQVLDQKEREGAIKEWKDYAKNVYTSLRAEIQLLNLQLQASRQELNEQRKAEMAAKVTSAKQEQVLIHLQEEVEELRKENEKLKNTLSQTGLRDRSDKHQSLE